MRSARRELRNSVGVILFYVGKDDLAAADLDGTVGRVLGDADTVFYCLLTPDS